MAQEITTSDYGTMVSDPDGSAALADQTGTSTTIDFGENKPRTWFSVRLYQKTFTAGTGANRPNYQVQVDSATGFATDMHRIGFLEMPRANDCTEFRMCFSPANAFRYLRIVPTLDGTDTINYDVKVKAA